MKSDDLRDLARKIGTVLKNNPEWLLEKTIETEFGTLTYIRKPNIKQDVHISYIGKKVLFYLNDKYVLCHFWGEEYLEDPTYFKRMYQKGVDIFLDERVPTPKLISYDDESLTWIIEKLDKDLSHYLKTEDREIIEDVIDKTISLFEKTWKKTKENKKGFPRYVRSFVRPEYEFLKNKKIKNYLSSDLVELYINTQNILSEYLEKVENMDFEGGIGFADVKLDNLVEDEDGNVYFIDADKPEIVHWITMFGQVYQNAFIVSDNVLFKEVLDKKYEELIKKGEINKHHITIGRMNRYLLPCTLRNVSFNHETNRVNDEELIRNNLLCVKELTVET